MLKPDLIALHKALGDFEMHLSRYRPDADDLQFGFMQQDIANVQSLIEQEVAKMP